MSLSILTAGIGLFERICNFVVSAFPQNVIGFLSGPANQLTIGLNSVTYEPVFLSKLRLIDVFVQDELVMKLEITLPIDARSDLHSAVAFELETRLPFSMKELLILVSLVERQADWDKYEVVAVKKKSVSDAMQTKGLPKYCIRSVLAGETSGSYPRQLVSGVAPVVNKLRRIVTILPLIALLTVGFLVVQARNTAQDVVVSTLEKKIEEQAALLRNMSGRAVELVDNRTGEVAVLSQFETSSEPANSLKDFMRNAAETIEVSRFEFRNGTLRISIESQNLLDEIDALNLSMSNWSISVDGAISTNPITGREASIISIVKRKEAGNGV